MLMPLRKPTSAEWAQVMENFDPIWAVTLTYNDDLGRTVQGVRSDLERWLQRMQHRIYSRNHGSKPRLEGIGWVEKIATNPHAHLGIRPPDGYYDLACIDRWLARQWIGASPNRGACVEWIDRAADWGSYIAKEEHCRSSDADHLIILR